jgi:hypothetical protein
MTEQSAHINSALELFGLDKIQTYFTDGGSAFGTVGEHLAENGTQHLLCSKHYQSKSLEARGGLGSGAIDFIRDVSTAIYQAFSSTDELDEFINCLLTKYDGGHKARTYLEKLNDDRHRVCWTYKCKSFTAGHSSTQRAESANSSIKNGKKKELRSYDI